MDSTQLVEIIDEWNFWHRSLNDDLMGIKREFYLKLITPLLNTREIILLSGARRAGKSTLIYQIIDQLMKAGTLASSILYINFEDYRFIDNLEPSLLEDIAEIYFDKINPRKDFCWFFLDEIQNVKYFEKYLRTIYDMKKRIKFVISGSNSKIMSGEIADILTGRNITVPVYPFSFFEFLAFADPSITIDRTLNREKLIFSLKEQKSLIKNSLEKYLIHGGYPEIIYSYSTGKEYQAGKIITQYFDDIILKDIIKRYNLRNSQSVLSAANFCIDNISNSLSYTKIAGVLGISTKQVIEYIGYFENANLIFQNRFFSWKIKETLAVNKPKKIYAIDHFYKTHMCPQKDCGRIVENVVYLELLRRHREIYYWKEKGEVDFVIKEPDGLTAIQVSYTNNINEREFKSLLEFNKKYGAKDILLITDDTFKTEFYENVKIQLIPLWLFLLLE